jgi:hypothetical protein
LEAKKRVEESEKRAEETKEELVGIYFVVQHYFRINRINIRYSLIRTSGHLIIDWGEDHRNPLDFTLISMENKKNKILIEINLSNINKSN